MIMAPVVESAKETSRIMEKKTTTTTTTNVQTKKLTIGGFHVTSSKLKTKELSVLLRF